MGLLEDLGDLRVEVDAQLLLCKDLSGPLFLHLGHPVGELWVEREDDVVQPGARQLSDLPVFLGEGPQDPLLVGACLDPLEGVLDGEALELRHVEDLHLRALDSTP